MRRSSALAVLALGACNPNPSPFDYQGVACGEVLGDCPTPLVCLDGRCELADAGLGSSGGGSVGTSSSGSSTGQEKSSGTASSSGTGTAAGSSGGTVSGTTSAGSSSTSSSSTSSSSTSSSSTSSGSTSSGSTSSGSTGSGCAACARGQICRGGTCVGNSSSGGSSSGGSCGGACLQPVSCADGGCSGCPPDAGSACGCDGQSLNGTQFGNCTSYPQGVCVDLQTDAWNCGVCGNTCGANYQCVRGLCCPFGPQGGCCSAGQAGCLDQSRRPEFYCADLFADPSNCGTCGSSCPDGGSCNGGSCQCPSGDELCTLLGSCLPANQCHCGNGLIECGVDGGSPYCADTATDSSNCGGCGTLCAQGASCSDGGCACPTGESACAGSPPYCANLAQDPKNCASCGNSCGPGFVCDGGCLCPPGELVCNSICTNPQTDPDNCGGCNGFCQSGLCCDGGCC
ncbi:MAG: hypothetical protein ACYDCL_00085 [Myxococcales bacterium]